MLNCCTCGRFCTVEPGASWTMFYSGFPLEPDHEAIRCKACTERLGPPAPQLGIRPEYSTGVFYWRQRPWLTN